MKKMFLLAILVGALTKSGFGRVLVITEGTGYYQELGKAKQIVHKGDVIKCLPGVQHWHGASPESNFAYFAVTPAQNGKTIWLKRVTVEKYQH